MTYIVRAFSVLVATATVFAAPAAGSDDEYLRPLQERLTFLSAEQLLSAGATACSVIRSGRTSTDAVLVVQRDLGISVGAAAEIVSAAVVKLGC